jgi:hypothetical protein
MRYVSGSSLTFSVCAILSCADIIGRIADYPIHKIDDLLPWQWKSQTWGRFAQTPHPAAVG